MLAASASIFAGLVLFAAPEGGAPKTGLIIGALILAFAIIGLLVFLYLYLAPKSGGNMRNLMGGSDGMAATKIRPQGEMSGDEFKKIQRDARRQVRRRPKSTLEERFFQAGIYTDADKREFYRLRLLAPAFTVPICTYLAYTFAGVEIGLLGLVMGVLIGLQIPYSVLDRKVQARDEEIMFFLPLVIEQIAIGVSSSLDIGPCIQYVIKMADERESHNVVTELLRHAHQFVRAGASLEQAMVDVGRLSGHVELKHTFMALAQVAKHGGEISKQLQELADAVASQRETRIEAKIKSLELVATGPVALVFCGFMVILLMGFFMQVVKVF